MTYLKKGEEAKGAYAIVLPSIVNAIDVDMMILDPNSNLLLN